MNEDLYAHLDDGRRRRNNEEEDDDDDMVVIKGRIIGEFSNNRDNRSKSISKFASKSNNEETSCNKGKNYIEDNKKLVTTVKSRK